MQRVVSFNICATVILVVLLFSLFSRKMTKGDENRSFLAIIILTLLATFCDIFRWVIPVTKNDSAFFCVKFCTNVYFIARMLVSSAYLIYTLVISKLWYKIHKQNRYYVLLLIIPIFIVIIMIVNVFTGCIFYFTENYSYHRGNLIYLSYISSFLPMFVSFILLVKEKRLFFTIDFVIILLIYPCVILGVILQKYYPIFLLENITTTFAVFAISLIVHRPEENLNVSTQTLGFNAYIQELKKNLTIGIPMTLIFIHVDNFKQVKRQFSTKNYNRFQKELIKNMSLFGEIQKEIYNLDNCNFVFTYVNKQFSDIQNAAERLQYYLNNVTYNKIELHLVTTLCVVKCPEEINDIDKILSFSNNFFRVINYKNVVTFLSKESKTQDFKLRTELDDIIKGAIEKDKFQVYYQPIYNVKTKKFSSAEALLRLNDENYGYIPPSLFIPAAEASGAIHKIGEIVINNVCHFISMHNFEKMGLEYIEINLSVAQCIEQNFAERFINILRKNKIDTKKLNLEITETASNYDKETTNKNIADLSKYGLTFSLDDYGTGYSNIKRVSSMPLSIIKLDKTFVDEYKKNEMSIVIQETIDMFKKMNKSILVEGIEDRGAFEYFTQLKCDYIQGFYFSKPLPEGEFVKFIRENNKASLRQKVEGEHV